MVFVVFGIMVIGKGKGGFNNLYVKNPATPKNPKTAIVIKIIVTTLKLLSIGFIVGVKAFCQLVFDHSKTK